MNRTLLKRLIGGGFSLLLLAFIYVLVVGIGGVNHAPDPRDDTFDDITEGQTVKRRVQGRLAWVSRLSEEQRSLLANDHPCQTSPVCVVLAAGKIDTIDIIFTPTPPPQLDSEQTWFGGFVDPSTGSVYDLGGTALLPADLPALSVVSP